MACPRGSAPGRTRQCTGIQRSLQASSSVRSSRSSVSLTRCERGARQCRCGRLLPVNSLDSALLRAEVARACIPLPSASTAGCLYVRAAIALAPRRSTRRCARVTRLRVGRTVAIDGRCAWRSRTSHSDVHVATSAHRIAAAPTKHLRRGAAQGPAGRHRRPGMGDRSPGELANFVEIMVAPGRPGTPARTLRAETSADARKGWRRGGGRLSVATIGQGDPALWCMVGAQVEVVLAAWAGEHGASGRALYRDRSHGVCGTMPRYDLR